MPNDQVMPHRIKPSEKDMLNSVWIDLSEDPEEFVQNEILTYLWVLLEAGNR